ncbi:MAG: radical SAM protein, partial [Clostridiales bacterium]|nr:radical SAM protein [Clostridiales bacterium]
MIAYKELFDKNIRISLKTAASVLSAYPASAGVFMRLGESLAKAEQRRIRNNTDGVEVPPMMIISTTDECNLTCKGCYACERGKSHHAGLTSSRASEILTEASELGVGVVLLAGGEPLLSHGWLDSMAQHQEMAGLVFTNGTLLDEARRDWFARNRHSIPILSREGGETVTDSRRGDGVYAKVETAMAELRSAGVPFGLSVTVTVENINDILTDSFAAEYVRKGCRLFVFVEYVPVMAGTDSLMLTKADKLHLTQFAIDAGNRH